MLLKLAGAADANIRSTVGIAAINTTKVLSLTRNADNEVFACFDGSSTIANLPDPAPAGMRAGVRTRSMNATFEWVMIFETQ